jgi:hypothetical protein
MNLLLTSLPARILLVMMLVAGSMVITSNSLVAQMGDAPVDTVRLTYHLTQGESITYRVISRDSILLYDDRGEHTMVRERVEHVRFYCDTIIEQGYVLTATTTDYAADEHFDTLAPVTRTSHPWVGRSMTFVMSPQGKRIALLAGMGDTSSAPGAPFQPLLLPFLGDSISYVGASKNFQDAQWMFENAFPPVYTRGAMFRVIPRRVDTLDVKAVELRISSVEQMDYTPPALGGRQTSVKTTINGGGSYYFMPKRGYPVGGVYSKIANFTIMHEDQTLASGRHLLGMTFELLKEEEHP